MSQFENLKMSRRSCNLIFKLANLLIVTWVLSSCGNGETEKQKGSVNDSTPAEIRAINEKINNDRNNADLYFQRAKANFKLKKTDAALGDMQIAFRIDSTKPDYYVFVSDLYFTQNKTRDTRDALRKAIKLDSTHSEALMKYSQLFYLLKKYDTATVFINRCLHYNTTSPVAHFQKGMILKEWGDTAKAISSFQSAAEYDQKYYEAYMQLGILFSVKKNPLALDYLNNALSIDPKSIEALYAKGLFLQSMGKYDAALEEYNTIIKFSPEDQNAAFNIGTIYFEQKKTDAAMEKFELTTTRDQNFFRGYYGMGRCFEANGQIQKAVDAYKKALALKPDYDLAAIQLDLLLRKGGKK